MFKNTTPFPFPFHSCLQIIKARPKANPVLRARISVLKEGRNLSVLLEPNVSNPGKDFTRTPNCQWRAGRAHLPTSRLCQGPASADTELSSPRSFPLAVPPARATEAPRSPQKFSAQKQLTVSGLWGLWEAPAGPRTRVTPGQEETAGPGWGSSAQHRRLAVSAF